MNYFDLFDNKHPFYQTPMNNIKKRKYKSVNYLIYEFPSGTNVCFFQNYNQNKCKICPEICAKALCVFPAFTTVGGQGLSPSINGKPPYYCLITGNNLFETILLNVYIPVDNQKNGIVYWKLKNIPKSKSIISTKISYLQGLTWQPRQILLIPKRNLSGDRCDYTGEKTDILISDIIFNAGWKYSENSLQKKDVWIDPNVSYYFIKNKWIPLVPKKEKKLFRKIGAFLLYFSDI
ncbi:MAG: type I-E CRISPR-associated protein Cse1/CasA [Promethearchaeota archaeon]